MDTIFETRTLLEAVEELTPVSSFLLDRYFPTDMNTDVFKTPKVLVEYKKGNRKVSPFISPRVNGVTLDREGSHMHEYEPPVTGLKRTLTIDDLEQRGFGEALYNKLTPAEREATMLMRDMKDMQDVIRRRMEVMASQAIFENKLVVKEYSEDGQTVTGEKEIKFYDETTNPTIFTPSANWSTTETSGKQIMADLAAMVRQLSKRGLPATDVLCAPNVADVLMANEYLIKLFDNRRIELGSIKPKELTDGVTAFMILNVNGRDLTFYSYDEEYEPEDGTDLKPFVPAGMIAVLAPNCGHTVFGGITQLEEDKKFHTYAGREVPRYLVDMNSNTKMMALRSAPLTIPHNENPWVIATVVGA